MIGGFGDRVRIQRLQRTQGPTGAEETWVDVATVWAQVVTLDAEAHARFQQAGNPEIRWKLMFRTDPLSHHGDLSYGTIRFVWRDRTIYPEGEIVNRERAYVVAGRTEEEASAT